MMNRLSRLAVCLSLGGLAAPTLLSAQDCTNPRPYYIPVEPARTALGLRGETRAQYLDRRFGSGTWGEDREGRIRFESPAAGPITVHVAPSGEANLRIDLIVESRIDYIDAENRQLHVTGHRPIGSYAVTAEEAAELSVPPDVFREPGALLAAVGAPAMRGARRYIVQALSVGTDECARRIYVEDRFTAIRLNREAGR